ncbi:MAG: tRNA (guanosine(37)-N1)-methyltransferase TrmD [Clostridiales bacterium]|nr:tRNA (guanosine(37)-N1)-methyltransferase TrmD [Clostridiales bacterium]
MKFTVLTLFPKQILDFTQASIVGRAINNGLLDISCVDIRDYSNNKHGKVDDTLYGGGKGMLLTCEPVYGAWDACVSESSSKPYTVYLSPKGSVLDQKKVIRLSHIDHLVLLCGHYEGIDQRVLDVIVDEEISIGDYVLTGGEAAACIVIDAVSRMIPGVLPDSSAYENESHMDGVLESPHFTKPEVWNGFRVPEVLRNGNHARIEKWRRMEGLYETYKSRKDLFEKQDVSAAEWEYIIQKESRKDAEKQ